MKRSIYFCLLVILGLQAKAQQQATFTNFLLNNYYYNPAIAGSTNVHMANLSYRAQWTGFDGAPKTILGSFYGSYKNRGIDGYGAMLVSDKTGMTQRTGVYLNYARHVKLGKKVKLGLGLQPGYVQYRVTLYDARLADQGDDVLTGSVLSANAVDLNGGFNLYGDNFFIMGSVNQLLGESIKFTSYNPGLAMHYTAIAGYTFGDGVEKTYKDSTGATYKYGSKVQFQPSIMMKMTSPTPAQFDIMAKIIYDKKYWAGLIYRTYDATCIALGYNFKNRLNIGYSYDFSMSKINQYQHGSHEVVLSFVITKKKPTLDEKDEELNNSIMDQMKKNNK